MVRGIQADKIKCLESESSYFSLLDDISVTIYVIDLKFSVCIPNIPLEEMLSQILYVGPSFH